ncbi:MAG TPA: nucleotidyl transferase AbiEii/AbiGii toxin family protein [Kofleriaceae bacterium]|nr:nucleotidyl transferase AbiEii/AbiGii toxin family protein [Kofleriaceae bacterium]
MTSPLDPLQLLGDILADNGLSAALIGGHAVNAWAEPRFTADIDITVAADADAIERVRQDLLARGYRIVREVGAELPSGPDFLRLVRGSDDPPIDLQIAKTSFQEEVIRRARPGRPPIATPEDLIVLKLIAHRPKDLLDLRNLILLNDLDWDYIEGWADAWEVRQRLDTLRTADSS